MPSRFSHFNQRIAAHLRNIVVLLLGTLLCVSMARANTQLLMLEEHGCVYCAKFNREIGTFYDKTSEGALAPLRRIDLYKAWPEDLKNVTPASVTPTFILVHNNQEVGRLYGYQGDEFFWFLLNELISKIPDDISTASELPKNN